jgi:hypothetical protein
MIQLQFEGWFECRLATDPDPSDEFRGISGWTFAVAGEPDLDRIIRFQPEESVDRMKKVGVKVTKVWENGILDSSHILLDAKVNLLDSPSFEGRNGITYEDTEEPIFPFHIEVSKDNILIQREFRDLITGDFKLQKSSGTTGGPSIMKEATGDIIDRKLFRQKRLEYLHTELSNANDEIEKIALQKRINEINPEKEEKNKSIQQALLYAALTYRYVLEGPYFSIIDPDRKLDMIDGSPWIIDFWTGVWDTDALCGYMKGDILLPSLKR